MMYHHNVNGEGVLFDVMDKVCQNLNLKDLCQVAQVCRSWNGEATKELAKRRHIERLMIPHNFEDIANCNGVPRLADALHAKPHLSILFMNKKLREESSLNFGCPTNLEHDVLSFYKSQLPNKMVGLEIDECLTDEDVTFANQEMLKNFALESSGNSSILGLFLPQSRDFRIDVAWCMGRNGVVAEVADRMVEKLAYDQPTHGNSALLIFARSLKGFFIAEQVVRVVRNRFPDNEDNIWGGTFSDELIGTNCETDRVKDGKKSFVGIRLTAPSLQSWTLTINCNARKDEVDQDLQQFYEKIVVKSCCVGFAYGPRIANDQMRSKNMYQNSHEIMQTVKRILPNIPFVGLFNRVCKILVTDDSLTDDNSLMAGNRKFMSIMVITYD